MARETRQKWHQTNSGASTNPGSKTQLPLPCSKRMANCSVKASLISRQTSSWNNAGWCSLMLKDTNRTPENLKPPPAIEDPNNHSYCPWHKDDKLFHNFKPLEQSLWPQQHSQQHPKDTTGIIAPSLTLISQVSLDTSCPPQDWLWVGTSISCAFKIVRKMTTTSQESTDWQSTSLTSVPCKSFGWDYKPRYLCVCACKKTTYAH